MRPDAIVTFPGTTQLVLVAPPATQDTLSDLAKELKSLTVAVRSTEFLLKERWAGNVSAAVICPDTGSDRKESLDLLFAMVHKALYLFKYAPVIVLLPRRDEGSRKDLEDLACRVSVWDRREVDRMASFIIENSRKIRSTALIAIKFLKSGEVRFSRKGNPITLKVRPERSSVFLQIVLQEDREYSKQELGDAMNCDEDQVRVYAQRLCGCLAELEDRLGVQLKIIGSKQGGEKQDIVGTEDRGYRLCIRPTLDK